MNRKLIRDMAAVPLMVVASMGFYGSSYPSFAEAETSDAFAELNVLNDEQMAELRGRNGDTTTIVRSEQKLQTTVNGSTITADSFTTGGVNIGEQNISGVNLISATTGSNNASSNTISVNFNLQ